MRPSIRIMIVLALAGIFGADAALAEQQRRSRRRDRGNEPAEAATASSNADVATQTAPQSLPSSLGLIVFPAANQSPEQQSADETECSQWARNQVSQAPSSAAPASTATESSGGRDKNRAGLKGAAVGAAVGELTEKDEPEPTLKDLSRDDVRGAASNRKSDAKDNFSAPESRSDIGDNAEIARAAASAPRSRGDLAKELQEEDDGLSHAEKGAAIGAVVGRRAGKKAEKAAGAQAAQADQAAAQAAQQAENDQLKKALSVCLEAKDYTVR